MVESKKENWTIRLARQFVTSTTCVDLDPVRFEYVAKQAIARSNWLKQEHLDLLYEIYRDNVAVKDIAARRNCHTARIYQIKNRALHILGTYWKKFIVHIDPYDNCCLDVMWDETWPNNFLKAIVPQVLDTPERYWGVYKGSELSCKLEELIQDVSRELHPDSAYQGNLYAVVTLMYYKDGRSSREIGVDRSLSPTAVSSILKVVTSACQLNKNIRGLYREDAWESYLRRVTDSRCYFRDTTMPLYKCGVLTEDIDKLAKLGIITAEDFIVDNAHALVEYLGESVYEDVSRCMIPRTKVKPSHRWDMHDPDPRNPFNKHTASHKYVETSVGRVLVPYDWTDAEVDEYIKQHTRTETKFVG